MRSIVLFALLLPACGGAIASTPELPEDASAAQDARQVVRLREAGACVPGERSCADFERYWECLADGTLVRRSCSRDPAPICDRWRCVGDAGAE
jgi:hypothetical protein